MSRNPDVLAVFPRPRLWPGRTAAHEAETNHEMVLHPPVLGRTGDGRGGMGGFFFSWWARGRGKLGRCHQWDGQGAFLGAKFPVILREPNAVDGEIVHFPQQHTQNSILHCTVGSFLRYYTIPNSK